jgi:hypothetical protein
MPTCNIGDSGLFLFRGPNEQTGLTSYAGGAQGKFLYSSEGGVTYAADGYKNQGLQIKNLGSVGKNLAAPAQAGFSNAVKALDTKKSASGGLPADSLKMVVTGLVKYYYPGNAPQ